MKSTSSCIVLAAMVCCLPQLGCGQASPALVSGAESHQATVVRSEGGSVERVTAGPPVRKSLVRYTTQPGWIEAYERAPLYSKVAGYVASVKVDIGDQVAIDQILVELRAPEMQDDIAQKTALVSQAEAEVQQAAAAVEAAKAAVNSAEARIDQANAGKARAEADYQRWLSESNRISELVASGSLTRKLGDEALHQLRSAEAARDEVAATVASAEASRNESQALVAKALADKVAAEARRAVAQADLKRAETMAGYLKIKAPFDGVITQRDLDTGHFVQPGSSGLPMPLLTVSKSKVVRVFVDIPEAEAALVTSGEETGDPASVFVQSLGDREFKGMVTRTSWSLDPANRSLRTEVDLSNPEGELRPGMYATVQIQLDERRDVLTLPATAVMRDGRQIYCYCIENDRISSRAIQLGLRSGADIEVVSGITESDLVVLVRPELLQLGQRVERIGSN